MRRSRIGPTLHLQQERSNRPWRLNVLTDLQHFFSLRKGAADLEGWMCNRSTFWENMGLRFDKRRDCEGKIPRWVAMVPKDCKIEHYSWGVLEKTCKGVHQCWANKVCEEAGSGAFHEMQQAIGS
jgi:hypothetical protein